MDRNNLLLGVVLFGFGVLTGYVLKSVMAPAPATGTKGILEQIIDKIAERQVSGFLMGQVPPWQVPQTRDPNYAVGSVLDHQSEIRRSKLAENILTYL